MRATEGVRLYFVEPPDIFSSYTKQTLKRIRGDAEGAAKARNTEQYVLKVDLD